MTACRTLGATALLVAAVTAVLILFGIEADRAVQLAVIPGGSVLAVGALGGLVLDHLQFATIRTLLVVVALVPVLGVAVAVVASATIPPAMSLSSEDVVSLLTVTAVAGVAATLISGALARWVGESANRLARTAESIGDGSTGSTAKPRIRELLRVAESLDTSAQQVAAERAHHELLTWASHDLRGPLTAIRVVAEALSDGVGDDPETRARDVGRLRLEAARLSDLIEDLTRLSRLEAGSAPLLLEPVSLADLVSDAVAAVGPIAEMKGVRLEPVLHHVPALPLAAAEVNRAIANLLDNAVRETPPGGTVTVTLRTTVECAVVEVADQCGGIDVDPLARPGLGLTIARSFVEAHGGQLSATDTGRGCRFTLVLPLPSDHRAPIDERVGSVPGV